MSHNLTGRPITQPRKFPGLKKSINLHYFLSNRRSLKSGQTGHLAFDVDRLAELDMQVDRTVNFASHGAC